jgi:hypothetical protein
MALVCQGVPAIQIHCRMDTRNNFYIATHTMYHDILFHLSSTLLPFLGITFIGINDSLKRCPDVAGENN